MYPSEVTCIDLRNRAPAKRVIAGVLLDIVDEYLSQKIPGVVSARRLTCVVNGRKEKSLSILLLFEETLLGYVRYPARAFVSKPLQYGNRKGYGHVSNVCRREKYDVEESGNGKCCNCGVDHTPDFLECPVRVNEVEGSRIRAARDLLCGGGEESRGGRGNSVEDMAVYELQSVASVLSKLGDLDTLIVKKVDFVAFIATVINCTAQVSERSKLLEMISAAETFLGLQDFTAEALQVLLSHTEGF
jgi:hypothetical protein